MNPLEIVLTAVTIADILAVAGWFHSWKDRP